MKLRFHWLFMTLCSFLFLSTFSVSHAGTLSQFISQYSRQDTWVQYIYTHQSAREKISLEQAREIARQSIIASSNTGVPLQMLLAVMQTESGFNPRALSRSGAKGLMQVVAYWHRDIIRGRNLYSVRDGIDIGAQILKQYLDKAHGNEKLALLYYCGYRGRAAWNYIASVTKKRQTIVAFVQTNQTQDSIVSESTISDSPELNYAGPSIRERVYEAQDSMRLYS